MTISSDHIQLVITFVVGGGLLTLVTQLARVFGSFRSGARASTREVIKDLAAARDEAEEREATLRRDKDYWRNVAGAYGFQLRSRGITPDPAEPMSPSERAREMGQRERRTGRIFRGQARSERAGKAPTTDELREVLGDDERS